MIAPSGTLSIQKVASVLLSYGIDTGEKKLYAWLRAQGYLNAANIANTKYISQGLFKVRNGSFWKNENEKELYARTFVTEKGLKMLKEKLKLEQPAKARPAKIQLSGLGPWDDISELKDRVPY